MKKRELLTTSFLLLLIGTFAASCNGTAKRLDEILVKSAKKNYTVGESVAASHIVVMATYKDGSSEVVNDYLLTPATFSEAGTTTVTVSYNEETNVKTTSYEVSVFASPEIAPTLDNDFVKILPATMPLNSVGGYKVTLTKAFEICKHEVTQAEYLAVMGINPSYFDGTATKEVASGEVQERRPVEAVSWFDAIAYCNRRTAAEGIKIKNSNTIDYVYFKDATFQTPYTKGTTVYIKSGANGYRLPTEAEWEIAARGGATGNIFSGCAMEELLDRYAWYKANEGEKTHQVMKKEPNSYGLYDMSGNVWEWCNDWYNGNLLDATDPVGPISGDMRVCRGGCYCYEAALSRVSYRTAFKPSYRYGHIGFRVVRGSL